MELPIYEDDDVGHAASASAGPSAGPSSAGPSSAGPSSAGPSSADHPRKKPFYAKRPHKKSRTGCRNCKARKVKCDEERPACQTCLSRKEPCVYVLPIRSTFSQKQQSGPASNSSRRSRSSRSSRSSRTESYASSDAATSDQVHLAPVVVVHEPVASLPGYDPVDMKIIWHFMNNTYSSFSTGSGRAQDIMRVHVMKHAFDVRFLLRSVLALSSLHARTCTGEEVCDVERHHFYLRESLQEYRLAIEAAEPRTFGALMVNSLLVTATSSESFRDPAGPDLYILQWLLVWRGIGVILDRIHRSALPRTGMTQLFHRPSMNLSEATAYIPEHLTRMVLSIAPQDADYSHKPTYMYGLKYLGSLYQHLRQGGFNPVMKLRIITWFTFLPATLVDLLREKRERALVILAHYAVFLKLTTGTWWLVGVGDRSLRDICTYLGQAWYTDIEVPLRAIRVQDRTELARLLLDDPSWGDEAHVPSWSVALPQRQAPVQDQEQETTQLGLVDDEGRPIRFSHDTGTVVLAEPSEPGEEPIWNKDE
ncbi:hypothetical protein E4U43_008481 [Claviceps pusilla]|uniref:Zn(2)-C6 fungal-type domain-containing protein n=1 Tax=Claviceps pusilla TaxID=123648 RepID=A0A9P7NAM4_9HYPO|nr:hypothetical protein E4U43_008481 [Claviceps pusilla]